MTSPLEQSGELLSANPNQFVADDLRVLTLQNQANYLSGTDEGRLRVPDKQTRSFMENLASKLNDPGHPRFNKMVIDMMEEFPGRTTLNWANLWLRVVQDYKLRNPKEGQPPYPIGHEDPAAWDDFFEMLNGRPSHEELWHISYDVAANVLTNIPDRSKILKLAILLQGFEQPVSLLDIGPSTYHGVKKLHYSGAPGHFKYSPTLLYRDIDQAHTGIPDLDLSLNGMRAINDNRTALKNVLGIDKNIPHGPQLMRKLVDYTSHCFYPSEYLRRGSQSESRRQREFRLLQKIEPLTSGRRKIITRAYDDITSLNINGLKQHVGDPRKLVGQFSMVGYLLGSEGTLEAIDAVERDLLLPGGWLLIFDSVRFEGGQPQYGSHYDEFGLRAYIKRRGEDPELFMTAKTGRAEELIPGPALYDMPKAHDFGFAA